MDEKILKTSSPREIRTALELIDLPKKKTTLFDKYASFTVYFSYNFFIFLTFKPFVNFYKYFTIQIN